MTLRRGGLLARIDGGLEAQGVDPDNLTIDDLGPIDEFHIGGRAAAGDDGPSPLGIHLLLGDNWRDKFKNVTENIERGRVSPTVMIATRRP